MCLHPPVPVCENICGGGANNVASVRWTLTAAGSNAAVGLCVVTSQSIIRYSSFCHYYYVASALPTSFLLFCHFSDVFPVHIPLAAYDLVCGIPATSWSGSGMSLSALELRTDLGMCQMKIAPSVPAVTMNC